MNAEVELRFQTVSFVVVSRGKQSKFTILVRYHIFNRIALLGRFEPRDGFFHPLRGMVEKSQFGNAEGYKIRVQLDVFLHF